MTVYHKPEDLPESCQKGFHVEVFEAYYWSDKGVLLAVVYKCSNCGLLRYDWVKGE